MKMNAPTELYENHHHQYKQQQQMEQKQMLLDNNVNAIIKPSTAMRMNGIKSHVIPTTTITPTTKQDEEERKNQSRNLAKINWWNTPFKPLTIETIVDQQQQQQQLENEQIISNLNKDESTSVYLLEQEPDQQQDEQQQQLENENGSERKEEQDSLMSNETKHSCFGVINEGEEDEMQITGYRRCIWRTILCWFGFILTAGLLRLVLHWWQHLYLKAMHVKCPIYEAEKVLVQDNYQGKHKTYYVKNIQHLNVALYNDLNFGNNNNNNNINNNKFKQLAEQEVKKITHFSVHFDGEHFEYMDEVRLFVCKQLRYVWNGNLQKFAKISGLDTKISSAFFHQQNGLTGEEQWSRRLIYGANQITVPVRDIFTLLFLEALNPFYVFQVFSVILWCVYDYYYYAAVIFIMSVTSVSMSVIQTKKNQDRLHQTVCGTGQALVLDEKQCIRDVDAKVLVPGDLIEIPAQGCIMQCDAILLSGNCIVDEAMLTGESVPITKTPLPMRRDVLYDKKEHSRHTLFCGTKVIQTRYIGSERVLAFVTNTGNITTRGGLVRSILYPPPVDYKFEQDSYKFIACLAAIALIGFLYTLITKIIRSVGVSKIIVESLDLITIVVPPALPAAMTVGRVYAQQRLKKNGIYCISPRAINVAGSIDCCCFDKTGTLTEEGLDMWGVVPKSATNQFQIPIRQIERLPADHFLYAMVTCHSITILEGNKMGDPLDLKMFESTGWILEDPKEIPDNQKFGLLQPTIVRQPTSQTTTKNASTTSSSRALHVTSSIDDLLADVGLLNGERANDHGIIREFPFSSSLQRMSVITRRLSEQHFNVYCKGAPEMLQQLCRPETLPDDYAQQLAYFAKQGYRIIATAYKPLSAKVNYTKVQRLMREQVEQDLEFLGFVILENRLKPDTEMVINKLRSAQIRTIMVTGDNMLTALSVARDCGMLLDSEAVITVQAHKRPQENAYELIYTMESGYQQPNVDAASITNSHTTMSILPDTQSYTSVEQSLNDDCWVQSPIENNDTLIDMQKNNYRLALTGHTWQVLRLYFPHILQRVIMRGVIFARMSPEQKQQLIQELQNIDYYVGMCGDGANDCGALKAAHTGISLSETESSIASPFTSRQPTIAAVLEVIREGRAALVTSFGIFKYMATYSMIQFVSVMILYSIDANLSDKQFLYIDIGLISIFAFFFSKTAAFAGPLAPQVPLSSLIALAPLSSLILHLLTIVLFQVSAWFFIRTQSWFQPFVPEDNTDFVCFENYIMFAVSGFQYIIMAFVYSKGPPYRQAIYSNKPFCLSLIINLLLISYLLVWPPDWLLELFALALPPDQTFRMSLLGYAAVMFVVHVIIEELLVDFLIFKRLEVPRSKDQKKSKKKYLQLEYNLQNEWALWPQLTIANYSPDNNSTANFETQLPNYVELSAEPQHKTELCTNPALNSFFDAT